MKKIVIIIPYFGPWPEWMRFFLTSCAHNPSIDWVLISDHPLPAPQVPNVRHMQASWSEYCRLVAERLGIHFQPDSPYKLCDLKPCLAYIHPELVADYDYWCFGDIDVVYGNLRHFFSDDFLRHALISTHHQGISGHLCLLRNEARINQAFKRIKNWRQMLSDAKHRKFDEGKFRELFLKRRSPIPLWRRLHSRLDYLSRNALFYEAHSTPYGYLIDPADPYPRAPEHWLWHKGRLSDAHNPQREMPYLHFMNWKSNRYLWINGHRGVAAWSKLEKLDHVPDAQLDIAWTIGWDGFRPA